MTFQQWTLWMMQQYVVPLFLWILVIGALIAIGGLIGWGYHLLHEHKNETRKGRRFA